MAEMVSLVSAGKPGLPGPPGPPGPPSASSKFDVSLLCCYTSRLETNDKLISARHVWSCPSLPRVQHFWCRSRTSWSSWSTWTSGRSGRKRRYWRTWSCLEIEEKKERGGETGEPGRDGPSGLKGETGFYRTSWFYLLLSKADGETLLVLVSVFICHQSFSVNEDL